MRRMTDRRVLTSERHNESGGGRWLIIRSKIEKNSAEKQNKNLRNTTLRGHATASTNEAASDYATEAHC